MSLDPTEPVDKLRGGWPIVKTHPTRSLEDGDRVGSLEVIASPGHTPAIPPVMPPSSTCVTAA